MRFRFWDAIKVFSESAWYIIIYQVNYHIYTVNTIILYIVSVLNRVYGNSNYQAQNMYVYKYTSPAY